MVRRRLASIIRRTPLLVDFALVLWQVRQAKFTMGVVGVVINDEQHILLVEHVFHPRSPWGLPGGWVDRHEDPVNTIAREMQEELSLTVDVGPIIATEVPDFPRQHINLAYLCYPRGDVGDLSSELLGYRWHTRENLPQMHDFQIRAIDRALTLV